MRLPLLLSFLFLFFFSSYSSLAQDSGSAIDRVIDFPNRFLKTVKEKSSRLEEKILAHSEKTLRKLERQEQRLKKKLARKDSLAASQVFGDIGEKYKSLREQLYSNEEKLSRVGDYIPGLDSLKTSLAFITSHADAVLKDNQQVSQVKEALNAVKGLDNRLQGVEAIRGYVKARRAELKQQLNRFGLGKEFARYNKAVYYYSQQIREYQEILKNPEKIERKTFELLGKLPVFRKFFSEHSELARLFPLPANFGTAQALQGLQTRADLQSIIQSQLASAGPNASQAIQQNIQQAQQQLQQWKQKVNELGGSSSDVEMPDFKPNTQKTKSFWKRLEFGSNLQNTRSTGFLPSTSEFGLSAGFKLNDRAVMGVGGSYRVGWKGRLNNLTVTQDGVGLRSYIDWKLKGSFYISGGYEQNYRTQFVNIQQLKQIDQWQQSGLIGISKKYSIGKKWKGDMKLLFDFLYKTHVPVTQPVLFRFGYSFN